MHLCMSVHQPPPCKYSQLGPLVCSAVGTLALPVAPFPRAPSKVGRRTERPAAALVARRLSQAAETTATLRAPILGGWQIRPHFWRPRDGGGKAIVAAWTRSVLGMRDGWWRVDASVIRGERRSGR